MEMDAIIPLMGIGLCALVVLQFAMWSASSVGSIAADQRSFNKEKSKFCKQLESNKQADSNNVGKASWKGFRAFRVDRLVKETDVCTSVYLVPDDGKPIVSFRPGQHLTFRFQIPGQSKPVVRCYSLSDGPGKSYYRISVKQVPPPRDKPELPSGRASTYINRQLEVGQRIEVKAPSGSFYLNEDSLKPIVLLAGGIGVTPMVSMLDQLVAQGSTRPILVAYGVNFSTDQAFKSYFEEIARQHANVNLLVCYSSPLPEDKLGVDYQVKGFVSADLLKRALPTLECEFYMCGPPPFLNSIFEGLLAWGVPEEEIRFEAFGPASIGKKKPDEAGDEAAKVEAVPVKFAASELSVSWDGSCDSLLEFAESNGVPIDSGCRAGSCGTCSTELISGKVSYPEGQKVNCDPGQCLVCVARPNGPIELGA